MFYIAHLSQRDAPNAPGTGDPYVQDLERREFIRELAMRLMVTERSVNGQPGVTQAQAVHCWHDAEVLWNARPWED